MRSTNLTTTQNYSSQFIIRPNDDEQIFGILAA